VEEKLKRSGALLGGKKEPQGRNRRSRGKDIFHRGGDEDLFLCEFRQKGKGRTKGFPMYLISLTKKREMRSIQQRGKKNRRFTLSEVNEERISHTYKTRGKDISFRKNCPPVPPGGGNGKRRGTLTIV